MNDLSIFWFRRDLRLDDNAGLYHALRSGHSVLPVFIFDTDILDQLEDKRDRRVHFIHDALLNLQNKLISLGSSLLVKRGNPLEVWKELESSFSIKKVFTNHDYEPYAKARDDVIKNFLAAKGISFHTYKDQVIFEKDEVMKDDGSPYTVFTPFSKRWKAKVNEFYYRSYPTEKYFNGFLKTEPKAIPSLKEIGFEETDLVVPSISIKSDLIKNYAANRDYPATNGTSRISVHLRFGTMSIRKLARWAKDISEKFLNELIWREFYQMILHHFPHVEKNAFRKEYDFIEWKNDEEQFEKWCNGQTGFPIVDAGMRELNATGYMHNRVRMIVASFLTKDLLIDWRWGEGYFAKKLLDYELASNNGGWQWAAGTGVDAAPYFRIFNPTTQMEKFDPKFEYVRKWVPEFDQISYPQPIIDHAVARDRALQVYKKALDKKKS